MKIVFIEGVKFVFIEGLSENCVYRRSENLFIEGVNENCLYRSEICL